MHALACLIACMNKKQNAVQYTVRDIPGEVDTRLREVAAEEQLSLNQTALRALERGLGLTGAPVTYRSLRRHLKPENKPDREGWAKVLAEMDQVNPADWQ